MNNLLFPLMPTWVSLDLPVTQVVGLKGIYMLNFTDILHFNVIWINHFLQYGLNFCVFLRHPFLHLMFWKESRLFFSTCSQIGLWYRYRLRETLLGGRSDVLPRSGERATKVCACDFGLVGGIGPCPAHTAPPISPRPAHLGGAGGCR